MHKNRHLGIIIFTTFSAFSSAAIVVAAPQYTLINLGSAFPKGMNDNGQVVGGLDTPDGSTHAFVWSQSAGVQDLATIAGDSASWAYAINDLGEVVGYSQPSGDGNQPSHAFTWQSTTGMVDIGAATGTSAIAGGINNQGQVVGIMLTGQNYQNGAGFIYTAEKGITPVSVDGIPSYQVGSINNLGQMIVGGPQSENFLFYTPGREPTEIQGPSGTSAAVHAMNDQGTVIGSLFDSNAVGPHAFTWTQSTGLIDLTPGALALGSANGINNFGDVVGFAGNADKTHGSIMFSDYPFLYHNGVMMDLTALLGGSLDGWTDVTPVAINDSGEIAGYGYFNGQGAGFFLEPNAAQQAALAEIPEPTSASLMLLGATLLLRRNRRGGRI